MIDLCNIGSTIREIRRLRLSAQNADDDDQQTTITDHCALAKRLAPSGMAKNVKHCVSN